MDYFGMYRDIWQFHKKYIDKISPDDSFWQSVVADTDKLCKQYGNCPFIGALVMNEVNEFERLYKELTNTHGQPVGLCNSPKCRKDFERFMKNE